MKINKVYTWVVFLFLVSCAIRSQSIEIGQSIPKSIVKDITEAWSAQTNRDLGFIDRIPKENCPIQNGEYDEYEVCTDVFVVGTKYRKSIGYSSFHAYRICNKSNCKVVFGKTNYGIEE